MLSTVTLNCDDIVNILLDNRNVCHQLIVLTVSSAACNQVQNFLNRTLLNNISIYANIFLQTA